MKVCLIGDFSDNLDEGFKNTSYYLADALEANHTVYRLNVKSIKTVRFWQDLAKIKPDLIHTIAQPTDNSFLFTHLLKVYWPQVDTVISMLRPERYFKDGQVLPYQQQLIRLTKPDLVLVQSDLAETQFRELDCTVGRLPNGVDLQKFHSATAADKESLRQKYGLDPARPVVLHVGHLEPDRNLLALSELPQAGVQVAVAGSLYMGTHHDLISELEHAGYHLFKGYQANIAELYMLADCYVFPPKPGNSLTMPLSVLEAMACDLPVITTPFSGLAEAFQEGPGLKFVQPTDPFLPYVQDILSSNQPPNTRQMVETFSWPAIAKQLEIYYEEL